MRNKAAGCIKPNVNHGSCIASCGMLKAIQLSCITACIHKMRHIKDLASSRMTMKLCRTRRSEPSVECAEGS